MYFISEIFEDKEQKACTFYCRQKNNRNHDGLTFTEIQKGTSLDGDRLTTVLKNLERCDFIISFQQFGNKSRGTL